MSALNLQPRTVESAAMRIAGLSGEYTLETTAEIQKQWTEFNAQLYQSADFRDATFTFGVVYPLAKMRYVSGVEVTADAQVPASWVTVTLPAQRYAVFAETGGVAAIRAAWMAIFGQWLPKSGVELASGPMLERYPENWIESGDFEIWLPLAG